MTSIKKYNRFTAQWEKIAEDPIVASNNQVVYQNNLGIKTGSSGLTFDGTTLSAAALTVDTNTLYVDSANNRVGIGTTTPVAPLDLIGSNSNLRLSHASSTLPTFLDVSIGGSAFWSTNVNSGDVVSNTTRPQWRMILSQFSDAFIIQRSPAGATWTPSSFLHINAIGNVGIGNTSPTEKFDVTGNAKVSGTMTVGGNLTVNGTTTTINSTTVTIDDPIFTLGGDTAPTVDDNKDRGIEFRWHNGTSAKVGFFGLDDSTGKFIFIPDATNTSEVFSGTKGTIDANIEWVDVLSKPDPVITVTLTGDVTGTANTTLTDLANGTITVNTTIATSLVGISDTAPGAPSSGDLWYNSTNGSLFIYYDSFWVEIVSAGPAGASGQWNTAQTTETKSDSYTLLTSDAGKVILMDKATAQNVTINASLDLSVGQRIEIIQSGAGQVTFVASGTTINANPGLKIRSRYSAATVLCVGIDSYYVLGDLSA